MTSGARSTEFLLEHGVPEAEIEAAIIDGTLPFVVLETLFRDSPLRYRIGEIADRVGQPIAVVQRVRRALGFADADLDELVGTDDDVVGIRQLFDSAQGRSLGVALDRVRTSASAMEKLADSIAASFGEGIGSMLDGGADPLAVADSALAENTPASILRMLTHVLRHELARSLHSERTNRVAHAELPEGSSNHVAVGFVDLVGMTETMELLDSQAIAELVARYEAGAYDEVVRHGGRVVKMLGDGAMFTAPTADQAATICLAIVAAAGKRGVPPARAGIAWGSVIRSRGDIYGPTVNRASRLCDSAAVGEVMVSAEVAEHLTVVASRPDGERRLKGIGSVEVWTLLPDDALHPAVTSRT